MAPTAKYTDPEVMTAFYQRLFPFRFLFQWLNHSAKPSHDFAYREFAFTLQNDAYLRYQSFQTGDMYAEHVICLNDLLMKPHRLRKDVLRLNPSRFEIGPVYSANPRDRKTLRKASAFRPLSKELVFDIDLTDYDEIRTCCSQASICNKCWTFMTMAIKVLDVALREDFGFEHILWVFSGRRGAHAWISDRRAREMDDSRRRAVACYLEVIKGGSQGGKKVNLKRPLHPHIARSLEILKPYFASTILETQDPFASDTGADKLLSLLPDKALNDALRKKWSAAPGRSSSSKWSDIDTLAKSGSSKTLDAKALLEAKQDIVLEYTYPRLDAEVSKKLNHLLKSPLLVHPKTGQVCVPIDTERVDEFDPLAVPTVAKLLSEVDAFEDKRLATAEDNSCDESGQQGKQQQQQLADYEKTSLKPYVDYFRAHVSRLLKSEPGVKREAGEDGMEF